ncbi:MAG: hypothetical protein A2163_02915 [Actinobacteria bacterium RBG_13_35_12]|nr:MAG: hypothetical protein A2163_02915 [Actinobacteria bacterium RBG_13_35_12]
MKTFFKKIGSLIVTKEIFEDKKSLRTLYKYFLIGLLVRFTFLPFFFQRDLLSTYQRAAETISTGDFGYDNQQMLTNVIHSIYLFIIKSIFPAINQLFSVLLEKDTWISWISFNSSYNVFTVLTLFKIPYLIFDIACMFLILRLSFDGEPENKLRVFKYWIFNPIVIFVLYIFARHDIIGVLAILVALLLAKKDRKYWAIIVLAFGIALRFFPILILPILVFYLVRTKKDYIILSLVGVSGLVAVEFFSYFYFGKSVIFPLLNTQHFDYLLSPKLELVIGSHSSIFIFVAVYIVIILSFLHIKKKNFDILLNYGAIIYLAYVGICYFHPQYMIWVVPFLIIIFVRRKSLLYYHWIQFALLMVILIYWGDLVTKFVFAPMDHKYFVYMTGIIPIIERFYDSAEFVNIFRSIFTGVSLWMIYLIYKDNKKILSDELKKGKIKEV